MTAIEISKAVGGISTSYIQEAASYFDKRVHPVSMRRLLVFADILVTVLSL